MELIKIQANSNSYNTKIKRAYSAIKFIVIHFTLGNGDTAVGEGRYFQRHREKTGAHFFIDRNGIIVKSVDLNRIAWSVGRSRYTDYKKTGGAKFYRVCTNSNSVSIELCDLYELHIYPSEKQIRALCDTIKYIKKHCPQIVSGSQVIRHFDVTGKYCPRTMCKPYGQDHLWHNLKARIVKECF